MGRTDHRGRVGELELTDYLAGLFAGLGWHPLRREVEPGRDNLLAVIPGDPAAPRDRWLLVDVHQDTVPVDGMRIPPWEGQRRDGRVYGRGACDVKGGMAAVIAALAALPPPAGTGRPTVALSASVDEEAGFGGIDSVPAWWTGPAAVLPGPPALALVIEPTELDVVTAHKGVLRWRCRTRGRAAHSSQPAGGINAIEGMAAVIAALRRYADTVLAAAPAHPLVGVPTLSIGRITGGESVNTVPDTCVIEIDRRLLPGESPATAHAEAAAFVARALGAGSACTIEHDPPFLAAGGLDTPAEAAPARALAAAVRAAGHPGRRLGVRYCTNASALAARGIPCLVFGPGSIDQAHTADEWIAEDQLRDGAAILERVFSSNALMTNTCA